MSTKLYGLGYYKLKLVGKKWASTGERVQMKLKPMTHTQAYDTHASLCNEE